MGKYESFFEEIANSLDLNETEKNAVVASYTKIGEVLAESELLKNFSPTIFPQGSMRLGTVVKPLSRDDYDIDLVCELKNGGSITPEQVKKMVGAVLKSGNYKNQLEEEHGRCWTVAYNSNPPYHLDILPGIEMEGGRVKATIRDDFGNYRWLVTNPKGFANWFLSISSQRRLFESNKNVEKVKDFNNKTPLQRAVQLIKRHRDVYFKENPDLGPASVIITTLCGLSFNGENTIESILRNIPIRWITHISFKNGKYSIKVPSLPDDDYADKWNGEDLDAANRFFEWHKRLLLDLDRLFGQKTINDFLKVSKELFTESTITRTFQNKTFIIESLNKSFEEELLLPATVVEHHPLFKHAKALPCLYVYKKEISFYVRAFVYNNEEDAKKDKHRIDSLEFDSYSLLLPKGKWIRFVAIISNYHYDNYRVVFQITNTGDEAAEDKDAMRGDFYAPEDGYKRTRIEHTAYKGTHFVQAFLIGRVGNKDFCYRKSQILTVNVGD